MPVSPSPQGGDAQGVARLRIPARSDAVRAALRHLCQAPPVAGLAPDARGSVELVLAEVLNNVVEHAYADAAGEIEITLSAEGEGLCCLVADAGLPMPEGMLPAGRLPELQGDLPEGGFGWYLIRNLATDITYRREGGRNLIGFCVTS
jgi:serine/threonine-protein kinase RsbW